MIQVPINRTSALLDGCYQNLLIELGQLRNAWQELYSASPEDPKLTEVNEVYVQPVIGDGVELLQLISELAQSLDLLSERSGVDF